MTDPVLRVEMEGSREFVITMPGTSPRPARVQLNHVTWLES